MEALLATLTPEQKKLVPPHLLIDNKRNEMNKIFKDKFDSRNYNIYMEFFLKYKNTEFYIILYTMDTLWRVVYDKEILEFYDKEELEYYEFKNNKRMELMRTPNYLMYRENIYSNHYPFRFSVLENIHILDGSLM